MSDHGFFHPDVGYWQTNAEPDAALLGTYPAGTVQVPLKPGAGYTWNGVQWTPPSLIPVEPPQVPQVVTRRQARQALLLAGRLQDVQPAIDAIADPLQRGLAQIAWEDSLEFERHDPVLLQLAGVLGVTSAELDALFIQAAQL